MNAQDNRYSTYAISWDQLDISPSIQIKDGILRKLFPLQQDETGQRNRIRYHNEFVELNGQWSNYKEKGSVLRFRLTNTADESIRPTRLIFPTESGLDTFIYDFDPQSVSFLRNGYQSWSTARSYRVTEKPLRPWLQIVSLASSNLANLPSNIPGILSSEMFSCITDSTKGESFFVGQGPPFNQFFYIRLNLRRRESLKSYFEIVFDFGRKLLQRGESITLDCIYFAKAATENLLHDYFQTIKQEQNVETIKTHYTGWCSWYYYFNRIKPEDILDNIRFIKEKNLSLNLIQIDDGYQQHVGDWLSLKPEFDGKMQMLADTIREAGCTPGIWIAPFIADRRSQLIRIHPEYLLRNEHGNRITAGYNPWWPGRFYYGLDITNPRFEEYIRKVIRVMVHQWGFHFLKCDFLFGGCLRGGTHNDLTLSRAEVLKKGMNIIREEAGKETTILGCGMPLSTGIGTTDIMRVGPDTGPFWRHLTMQLLRTGSMVGVRNAVRNVLVRSAMHKKLWINDPDCLMLRKNQTKLNPAERMFHLHAVILSGGPLLLSDDLCKLGEEELEELQTIQRLAAACATGEPFVPDLMHREIPQICYNTAGYLGFFNGSDRVQSISCIMTHLPIDHPVKQSGILNLRKKPRDDNHQKVLLTDVWNGEKITVDRNGECEVPELPPHGSRLFSVESLE